jgi:hypothetical protein
VSPILVRPVREQLEHDRIIRLLQAKYKRKFDVAINPGNEQTAGVGSPNPWFPDLVLQGDRGKKVLGVVEVETVESVNHLEAMSEWRAFSQLGPAFHLYVPTSMIDVARRLCEDMQISVGEFWAYTVIGDQPRFTLVQRTAVPEVKTRPVVAAPKPAAARPVAARLVAARPAAAPRPAAPARAGANGQARTRARAAAPTAARSKGAAKKTARPAVRRAAPQKPAARAGRSAPKKSASSTRAQKRK